MPFEPVKMTLRVTNAGSSVEPVDVKRAGPDLFRLLAGSIPTTPPPGLGLPKDPAQPFICPDSTADAFTSGQTSKLSFDDSLVPMSLRWTNAFKDKRTLLLQMEIPGQLGEKLTVKLQCVDETQVSVPSAFAKVAETGIAFVFAIASLLKTVALFFARPFTRRRREEEPELLPANGPQSLE
jgi:hypothetical protein